ncbi:MAG: hypothetical protein NTZ05_10545 [Chloroflexi bacterium]|nr:hypothetical protein [Chloroflexota bacterium]
MYGLQGVTSLLIKPVWGMPTEKMDGRYLAIMEFGACTAGFLLLLAADSLASAVLGIAVFGTGIGGVVIIMEVVWADAFGRRHLGAVRSLATPFTIVASSGAPLFASAVFDATGSYQGAFLSFIAAFGAASALILAARPPSAPEGRRARSANATWSGQYVTLRHTHGVGDGAGWRRGSGPGVCAGETGLAASLRGRRMMMILASMRGGLA